MKRKLWLGGFAFLLLLACGPAHYAPVQVNNYNYGMEAARQGEQTAMNKWLRPYADSVNNSMNIVLGKLEVELTKSWPSCTLGSFMTDAYLESAQKKFGKKVDIAVMNYGGIRLGTMSAGEITKGKIYELMPFDNLMVLLQLSGEQLKAFFDHMAFRGGWPVSGARYTIENRRAIEVTVGDQPIDLQRKYWVATSDYVANGGDESNVLKGIEQLNIGYLQRDAIIEYVVSKGTIGEPQGIRVIKDE